MADARGRSLAPVSANPLRQDLLDNPQRYGFFQAIRLLRLFACREGGCDDARFLNDNLRIRPDLSLAFPGTDMTDLSEERDDDQDEAPRYHITATFLELYGSASPLPTFYTEELLDDASDDNTVVRDFVDIVNSPLYPLIIRAWSKYRLPIKVLDEEAEEYLERLFCLAGLGLPELRKKLPNPLKLLRYIGLFSQWPRSPMGLRTLLADAVGLENSDPLDGPVPVEVTPCVRRCVAIPMEQRCSLGVQNNELGEDAICGEKVQDRLGKITVHIGPLNEELYHACLPGSPIFHWISVLIRLYLLQPLDCDLELKVEPTEARTARLGTGKWSALGMDTWIFSSQQPEEASAWFPVKDYTL